MPIPVDCRIVVQVRGHTASATLPHQPDAQHGVGAFAVLDLPPGLRGCLDGAGPRSASEATEAACREVAEGIVQDHFPRAYDIAAGADSQWHLIVDGQWVPGGSGDFGYGWGITEYDDTTRSWVPMERVLRTTRTEAGATVEEELLARFLLVVQKA